MQESVVVLLLEVKALENPFGHTSHLGWVVVVPDVFVYLPGGHLVWAVHKSALLLFLDVDALKNPVMHASQSVWALIVPAAFVYLPGGQWLCLVHHSKGQCFETKKHFKTV